MMFRYSAFGLSIESEVRLDELCPQQGPGGAPDLVIRKARFGETIPPMGHCQEFDFVSPDGIKMMWPGAASVRIRSPGLVEIEAFPDVPEAYLAFPLLGPVMGWLLHMRGFFVLHASAAEHKGCSVAFLGDKGAGKSTTGSAFLQQGWRLITDDLLAISAEDGRPPQLQTAFAQMKLNSDAPQTPIPGATMLAPVMEGFPKRQYRLDALAEGPLDTGLILVLQRGGDTPAVEWLDTGEAITALLRFSYNVRFADAPLEQQDRARQFRQAVAIANATRIGTLHVPHSRERLPETVDFVARLLDDHGG